MIYLDENTKRVYIPKTQMINPNTIEFENNITHNKIEFDVYDLNPNVIKYDIDLTQNLSLFTNGQYTYRLWSETHDLLSSGVAQFGEFNSAEATDYNANVDIIEYKMEN